MNDTPRLLAVLAHPDDESLGVGGALALYAANGVAVSLLTATRGQNGRYGDGSLHPGPEELGRIREAELRRAAAELGVHDVTVLEYVDGKLDSSEPAEIISRIAAHIRTRRPHVVVTFGPDGAYGHPDHIAICQFTTAAVVAAAADANERGHRVDKLYYLTFGAQKWDLYQKVFKKLVSRVDGVERQAVPWPDWVISTRVDASSVWRRVWAAVRCHESQLAIYSGLDGLSEDDHRAVWGVQEFYRAFSMVNGGRRTESDLFEGIGRA